MYSYNEHIKILDIVATEICEELELKLLETGRLSRAFNCNPHHPESSDDIIEFQDLVDIVKKHLIDRVYTFNHLDQK